MRHAPFTKTLAVKAAAALGLGLAALGPVWAQDAPTPPAPATPPGPAQQPAPAPGTEQPAPTQPVPITPGAAPATPPPNYNIQYNGLVSAYYQFQFHNPKDANTLTGRAYDIRHNSPTVELAALNVFKTPRPNNFGFYATFFTGDLDDQNHAGAFGITTGEGRYKNLQQLYGTYALGAGGAGVDFGKFLSPFGYEVPFANADYNFSRSIAYGYTPAYHAGARIYTPVPGVAGLAATFYLVNSVINTATAGVQNDSKHPGYMGQLNYTDPKGKFSLISELGLSKDKLGSTYAAPGGPETRITLNDNNFTYNFSPTMLAGVDYLYRRLKPDDNQPKGDVSAYAVYFRQQFKPKDAYALRFSGAVDHTENAQRLRPYEITGTYEYKAAPNLTTRLEYRHDQSNVDSFLDGDGNITKKNQDTLTLAGMFTF